MASDDDTRVWVKLDDRMLGVPLGRLVAYVAAGVVLLFLCALVSDWVHATYFVQVKAPLQRQILNHDPAWERAQQEQIVNDYTAFQQDQQKLPADRAACLSFIAVHGPAHGWSYQEQQEWHELYDVTLQGDYQAEISAAADLNAHELNSDQRPDVWPAGVPTHLEPDAAPEPITP